MVSAETSKITNTAVQSIGTFSNIDNIIEDSVSRLVGKGLESAPVDAYLSCGASFCIGFPQGLPAEVLGLSYFPKLDMDYNWGFSWGVLSIGLTAGINITGTQDNTISEYNLYSILGGLSFGYGTSFDSFINMFIKASPGADISFLIYPAEVSGGEPIVFRSVSFAVTAELGAVFEIADKLRLKGFGEFTYVMFSADDLILISPGLGISYRF